MGYGVRARLPLLRGGLQCVQMHWLSLEQFQVAFIGTAGQVPSIALTPLATIVSNENVKCNNKAYGISLATPLTIAATYPAA